MTRFFSNGAEPVLLIKYMACVLTVETPQGAAGIVPPPGYADCLAQQLHTDVPASEFRQHIVKGIQRASSAIPP